MIDVDQFKLYNNHYGHPAGDYCLKMVAEALAKSIRSGATVAALALPHAKSIHGIVTISIGIASLIPERDRASASLFSAADRALYQAKQDGRNRVAADDY